MIRLGAGQPPHALVIARDWALSEQHDNMLRDPAGTGRRHAQEWHGHADRLGFDRANTLVLGINERTSGNLAYRRR